MDLKRVFKTVDEYIATFPGDVQVILEEMRQAVKEAAPDAEEVISYQMPAFEQGGILVYFAAFKNHIGFFPTASGVEAFKERLVDFKVSKGTVQFPLNRSIPKELIKEMIRFRVKENLSRNSKKKHN